MGRIGCSRTCRITWCAVGLLVLGVGGGWWPAAAAQWGQDAQPAVSLTSQDAGKLPEGGVSKSFGPAAYSTRMVKDINTTIEASGLDPTKICDVGGIAYFVGDAPGYGEELWKSDGTAAGTVMVKDIIPGIGTSLPQHLIDVNGTLFFEVYEQYCGVELWNSEGTAAGTIMNKNRLWSYGYAEVMA